MQPSRSASFQSKACTPSRARAAWPLTAAIWMATLCSFACRDTREDTNYCSTCTSAEAPEGSVTETGTQEGSSTGAPASSDAGNNSQTPATGIKTGPAAMMSMSEQAGAGRSADNNAAASGGASASSGGVPVAGTRGEQAGSAARGGNGGRAAANGGNGSNTPRDAGSNEPEPRPDAGNPTPVPCNGPCPNNIPVCDESRQPARCVQCNAADQLSCTGDTSTCDVEQNKCVECTEDDARHCKGDTLVCNRDNRCVVCTNDRPTSCPDAQPYCVDEKRCVECRSNVDCPSDRSMCTADGKCVTCMNDAQCQEPAQPRCDRATNACVGCEGDNECAARFPDMRYCDKDTKGCVACTPDVEPRCGAGLFCDPKAKVCVPGEPKLRNCQACQTDSDCGQSASIAACIAQDNARFCFAASLGATPCEPGYMPAAPPGRGQVLYCMPIAPVTCQTIASAVNGNSCNSPRDCGSGGQCAMPPNGTCKLSCNSPQDCPAPLSCEMQMRVCQKKN